MKRTALRVISLLSVLFLFAGLALAQTETGTLTGTVTDSTGAVVPGATVTAVSQGTGATRSGTTASAGEYTITTLRPGMYQVTIEKAGFQKYSTQVKVVVGSVTEISAKLNVTGASTTVEVTASGEVATVNTETQTLSSSVNSKQVSELPTLTRNPYDLVATSGNVNEDSQSGRGAGYSINGARSASTSILLDGGENVNLFTATVGQSVPLDSVQEFTVLTNNFLAEYGRASGGVVNVVTKSGTNQFHGSLYEFNRVSALAANTYNNNANDITKPGFTRNQFGYAIGGPIVKNKLFFFSSTEWTRIRSSSTITQSIIDPAWLAMPQVDQHTKDFFNAYGALTPGVNVLQKVNWGQATGYTTAADCAPFNCTDPLGEYIAYSVPADSGGGSPQNTYSTVNRVDWNISDKSTLSGRYALYSENDFPGTVNASPYVGYNTGQTNFNQNVNITFTHIFTPTLVNSSKVIFNRLNQLQPLASAPVSPTLYVSATGIPNLGNTNGQLIFPGYSATTPGNAIPFGGPQNLYQFYNDLSWTKGRHSFKFGGDYIQTRDNRQFGAYENAVQALNSGADITGALANLTIGQQYQFQGASYPQGKYPCHRNLSNGHYIVTPDCTLQLPVGPPAFSRNFRYNDGAFYLQDSWKATSRLTVNLGIRWEYYGVQHNSNPALDSNFYLGSGSNIFDQIRNGQALLTSQGPVGGFWAQDKNNWAPRVGLAYDVFGNGTTSIRGGYGIGYERNFGNVTYNVIQNPPNYAVVSITNGTDIATLPIYTDNSGPLAGSNGTKFLPNVSLRAVNQNMKTAYNQFWSFGFDQQVSKGNVVSVDYSGSHGVHGYDIANINVAGYGGNFLGDARFNNRLNTQYSNMNYRSDNGFSMYNGLNVKFQSTNLWNKGLFLVANYTWSHSIDNISSTFSDGYSSSYGLGYLDAFNPALNKGNSDYDIRNRFVVSGVWDIPYGNNLSGWEKTALGGWSFSPIFKAHSGNTYSIFDSTDIYYTAPLYVGTQPIPTRGSTSASNAVGPNLFTYFALPTDSTGAVAGLGNGLGIPNCTGLYHVGCTYTANGQNYPRRNAYFGPGYWNFDMVIAKTFKLTERFNLQFRGELYNAFNHHNDYINYNNLDAAGTSTIQFLRGTPQLGLADERRNVQFGLKLNF